MDFDYSFDRDEPRVKMPGGGNRRRWLFAVIFTIILLILVFLFRPESDSMPADEQPATGAAESSETTEGAVESENSGSGLSFTADQSRVLSEASRSVAGNPVKAKAMAGNLLKNFAVGTPEWEAVADVIGKANIKIMMDKVPCDKNVEYTVVSGDSFIRISNKFDTTNLLIWKVNGIPENSSHLGIGDKLTIYKNSGWHIEILKSKGLLCVYDGPELFKVYRVGISSKNPPAGEYTLPGSKKRVMDAGGDRNNPYGSRFMGFNKSEAGGIHGCWDGDDVRKPFSDGYIRLSNSDIEELYLYIPGGTKVKIAD